MLLNYFIYFSLIPITQYLNFIFHVFLRLLCSSRINFFSKTKII